MLPAAKRGAKTWRRGCQNLSPRKPLIRKYLRRYAASYAVRHMTKRVTGRQRDYGKSRLRGVS
jgi:hypothetical protein